MAALVLPLLPVAFAAGHAVHEEPGAARHVIRLAGGELRGESSALAATEALLPDRFRRFDTRHFVVLSDADLDWTRDQLRRLERTNHQFERVMRRLGVELGPARHKLVCVLFERRADYRAFATRHDGVQADWIAGYYAPASDRIVFYQGDDNPSVVEARARLEEMEADLGRLARRAEASEQEGRAEQAAVLREHQETWRRHLASETARVDAFAEQVAVATTVHEAIHQLLFHRGVQSPRIPHPLWVSEGLATSFETNSTQAAFGPDHEHEPRRLGFDQIMDADELVPLRELVTWQRVPDDARDAVDRLYHQGYALLTWIFRFRRDELRDYLERLNAHPPGALDGPACLVAFEASFGSVERLERSWLSWERSRRRSRPDDPARIATEPDADRD